MGNKTLKINCNTCLMIIDGAIEDLATSFPTPEYEKTLTEILSSLQFDELAHTYTLNYLGFLSNVNAYVYEVYLNDI